MFRFLCLLLCLLPLTLFASVKPDQKINHVIYVTVDGARWQDIYLDRTYFPKLWKKHAKHLIFYGEPGDSTTMEVASIPVSLPSYQSQMSGAVQPCDNNACGRIGVQTFPEDILLGKKLNKKEVAIFSSWYEINFAAEHVQGRLYTNTGNVPVTDPDTSIPDAIMETLNQQQLNDHPKYPGRYDKYTFAQALHYFEKYQPHFMWISLLDADEAAHAADLERYHAALTFYDDALEVLFNMLSTLKLDKDTLVIVTTDHGRGNGDDWTSHGSKYPESKQTWAFVMNGELAPINREGSVTYYSTLSIKPTVEAALGLSK